jgi:hypothetical protein
MLHLNIGNLTYFFLFQRKKQTLQSVGYKLAEIDSSID